MGHMYLIHSAKGTTWNKGHKYTKIENGRYYYNKKEDPVIRTVTDKSSKALHDLRSKWFNTKLMEFMNTPISDTIDDIINKFKNRK